MRVIEESDVPPLIYIDFDELHIKAYLDNGASSSIISKSLVDQLRLATVASPFTNVSVQLLLHQETIPAVHTQASFSINCEPHSFVVNFLVADSPRYPIVLGRDFLSTYNITLTPKHAVIPSLLFPVRFIGAYPAYDAVMKVVQNFKERTPPTGLVSTTPYKIKVKTTPTFTPAKLPSYNIDAEEFLQKEVEKLLHEGKIERVSATDSYAVPFAVNKNSTFYRMVVNFKPINDYIQCPPSEFTPIKSCFLV